METEYFPPRELVILQNEAPTDVYILVSGAVVSTSVVLNITIFSVICNIHVYYHFVTFFGRKSGLRWMRVKRYELSHVHLH
jgi:hypothetical protein